MKVRQFITAALFGFVFYDRGATLVLPVTEDTSLFEANPTFNLGAANLAAGSINETLYSKPALPDGRARCCDSIFRRFQFSPKSFRPN